MRHNLARGRLFAAYLLGFFCAFSVFSQNESTDGAVDPRAESGPRPFQTSISFDRDAGKLRFESELPLQRSARGKSRTGILPIISSATGLTQFGDARLDARLGLFSSNGQRTTSNLVIVDGVPANLGIVGDDSSIASGLGAFPALTASGGTQNFAANSQSAEIVVRTMAAANEQGIAGAQLELKTRGGNNSYRGGLFEIFGNEVFNANDAFAQAAGFGRAPARLNQFGGTLGGFIVQNRLWFYGGYDGLRLRQQSFATTEVPDFQTRQTAADGLRGILAAFPIANGRPTGAGTAEFSSIYANPAAHDIAGVRLDFQPTSDLRLGGRYNFSSSSAEIRGDRETSLSTISRLGVRGDSIGIWASATPTSTIVVQGRTGFSRNRVRREMFSDTFGGGVPLTAPFAGFKRFDFTGRGASIAQSEPMASRVNQFYASSEMVVIAGGHLFTFGGEFRRLKLDIGAAAIDRNILFDGFSSTSMTTAARVTELSRTVSRQPDARNFSFYFNDSFRAFPSLTFTYGLRNDSEQSIGAQTDGLDAFSTRIRGRGINLAPRFGVAAQFFSGKTVVRTGGGLFYQNLSAFASDSYANSIPFAAGTTSNGVAFDSSPTSVVRPMIAFDREIQTPRAWHLFAEVEQQLTFRNRLTATYTSSFGRNLLRTRTIAGTDPRFNYLRLTTSDGESDFDSLQLRFERRLSNGIAVSARYAFQRSRDDFSPDALRDSIRTSADPSKDRGASDFDIRHQLWVYGSYDLPALFESGWKKALTDDWSVSMRFGSRTALPVAVGYVRVGDFGREFVRADRVGNAPLYLGEGSALTLNRAAFAVPAADGNLERNSVRGFGLSQLDSILQRRIRITNEMRVELGLNIRNVLNQTNFADMSGNLGTRMPNGDFRPNNYFGRPVSTSGSNGFTPFYIHGGPRSAEFTLRFVF